MPELLDILRRHWGFDAFRPQQEAIVRSLLAGHDACVVMPTGGGKSLCYQLPAAMQPDRTVIVVSPLISLMQDQVAQLQQAGIAAAVLNSSLEPEQARRVQRGAAAGKFRLLYLSPERLARPETVAWLRGVPVSFFVVDEAHCISEWGHEFRPEYRQLSALRQQFPACGIAAFTASATRRVRHDILEQLQLRQPDTFIASFHRSNLRYLAQECKGEAQQRRRLLRILRHHAGESVIVYAATTRGVDETAQWLARQGVPAIPYHGKMDAETRRRHQAAWMDDQVRVLVGTLAFGLGINKPAVRGIVHLALTKSIEQYYQEAGRGGRDGLPADCFLLWRRRDLGLLAHFIESGEAGEERERAWQRYHQIKRFVGAPACRHRQICLHFGETPRWQQCGACDVCMPLPEWFLARTVAEERPRARRARAAQPAQAPAAVPAPPPALAACGETNPWLPRRSAGPAPRAGLVVPNGARTHIRHRLLAAGEARLLEHLSAWRLETAKARGLPAFMVFSNAVLREICRRRPGNAAQLLEVPGVGPKKIEQFGDAVLGALARFS